MCKLNKDENAWSFIVFDQPVKYMNVNSILINGLVEERETAYITCPRVSVIKESCT